MTLTVGSRSQPDSKQIDGGGVWGERIGRASVEVWRSEGSRKGCPPFNARECQVLLEEPAIGSWAVEAATEYGVTSSDALELLAYALFLDGEK